MMYETEEQQVEALKKWWKDNGKSIIAGVVLGLGGVLGWKAWVDYRDRVAAEASNVFDQLVSAVDADNKEVAEAQARLLHQNFDSTPYSAFANLMQARLRYQQGDTTGTKEALEQAIAKAPEPALKVIAVLRLARVHIAENELDAAESMLNGNPPTPAFEAEYAVLRGDIARARGDVEAARTAYEAAIAGGVGNADLVQLKLENLPPAS
jgi:predicted negative regulator of RcsB-dependent stress response